MKIFNVFWSQIAPYIFSIFMFFLFTSSIYANNPASGMANEITIESLEDETSQVRLIKVMLSNPSPTDYMNFMNENPDERSFPNQAFLVVETNLKDPSKEEVKWIAFAHDNRAIFPKKYWDAELIWDVSNQEKYVILMKASDRHVTLYLYEFEAQQKIANYPIDLSPEKFRVWPQGSKPVSTFKGDAFEYPTPNGDATELPLFTGFKTVTGFSVTTDVDKNKISVAFEFDKSSKRDEENNVFELDLTTKSWEITTDNKKGQN